MYDVVISYKKSKVKGNVLFSHVGLTGPGIINLSNEISEGISYNLLEKDPEVDLEIAIDLCPELSHQDLTDKFNKDFQVKGKTMIKNYLKLFLTNRFIEYFLNECNIDGETQLSRINKKSKNRIIENLKRFTFNICGFNSKLSKVTIGGVDLKHINPKTMESTVTPNLFFAGEVLDLHGLTGGLLENLHFQQVILQGCLQVKINFNI